MFTWVEDFVNKKFPSKENNQLLDFQRTFVIDYYKVKNYHIVKQYDYDFLGDLLEDGPLENKTTYKFDFIESKDITIERFLEKITQVYARFAVVETAESKGFNVTTEHKDVDNTIEIVMEKWE